MGFENNPKEVFLLNKEFYISYDQLPISVNNYLRPSARIVNGKAVVHMYETKESKDWKKRFRSYISREVKKQGWDMSITESGHWYLDCVFVQSRTNQDNNNYYKILCDSLSNIVICDDKNVLVRTQKVLYDAKNPRFIAVLRPVSYYGVFNNIDEYRQFVIDSELNPEKSAVLRKAREGRIQDVIKRIDGKITYIKKTR